MLVICPDALVGGKAAWAAFSARYLAGSVVLAAAHLAEAGRLAAALVALSVLYLADARKPA